MRIFIKKFDKFLGIGSIFTHVVVKMTFYEIKLRKIIVSHIPYFNLNQINNNLIGNFKMKNRKEIQ